MDVDPPIPDHFKYHPEIQLCREIDEVPDMGGSTFPSGSPRVPPMGGRRGTWRDLEMMYVPPWTMYRKGELTGPSQLGIVCTPICLVISAYAEETLPRYANWQRGQPPHAWTLLDKGPAKVPAWS